MRCPHLNCSPHQQSMCSVHYTFFCAVFPLPPNNTLPKLKYQSSSTCISECGTSSWACYCKGLVWNLAYRLKLSKLFSYFYLDLLLNSRNNAFSPRLVQVFCDLVHGNSAAKVFMKLISHSTKWISDIFYSCICLLACISTTFVGRSDTTSIPTTFVGTVYFDKSCAAQCYTQIF